MIPVLLLAIGIVLMFVRPPGAPLWLGPAVAAAVGDAVKRGQELIVVEAMKMENALVAPTDGVVMSVAVKVGDMVAPGPALIVIEPAAEAAS